MSRDSRPSSGIPGFTRREFLQTCATTGLLVPASTLLRAEEQVPAPPSNVRVIDRQVLTPNDIRYLGLFKLPLAYRMGFSRGYMTGRVVNGEIRLFVTGAAPGLSQVVEMAYPGQNPSAANAPRANVSKFWGDVTGGRAIWGSSTPAVQGQTLAEYPVLHGIHFRPSDNQLWWAYATSYSGGTWNPSVGTSVLDENRGTVNPYGPWRTTVHSGSACGYMMDLPSDFSSRYTSGLPMAIGNRPEVQVSVSSVGANLIAFKPPSNANAPDAVMDSGSQSIQTKTLIYHDANHRQARNSNFKICGSGWASGSGCGDTYLVDNQPGIFGGSDPHSYGGASALPGSILDYVETCSWIDTGTKHGILYLGQLVDAIDGWTYPGGEMVPHNWYSSSGVCCHGHDGRPAWESTGPGAGSMVHYGWIYDPSDVVKSAQGQIAPYALTPKSTFKASVLGFTQQRRMYYKEFGATWYEPSNQLLFLTQINGEFVNNEPQPIVHVFQIQ